MPENPANKVGLQFEHAFIELVRLAAVHSLETSEEQLLEEPWVKIGDSELQQPAGDNYRRRIRVCLSPATSRRQAQRDLTCKILGGAMPKDPPGLWVLQQSPYRIELILSEVNGGASSGTYKAAKVIGTAKPPEQALSRTDTSIACQVNGHGDK